MNLTAADLFLSDSAAEYRFEAPESPLCLCGCGAEAERKSRYARGCGEEAPDATVCSCGLGPDAHEHHAAPVAAL
jgi:hypothetical protein